MNKNFFKIIPAILLCGFISYTGFKSYFTYKRPVLIEIRGTFLKIEELRGNRGGHINYHILLENDSKRYDIVGAGFRKDDFMWDVIFKDPLVLLVRADDYKRPRNGLFGQEEYKNQVSVYGVRGPKRTYLTKESSYASTDRDNNVSAPIIGIFGIVGVLLLIFCWWKGLVT